MEDGNATDRQHFRYLFWTEPDSDRDSDREERYGTERGTGGERGRKRGEDRQKWPEPELNPGH